MKPYRALGPMAMLVSVAVLAQAALPMLFPHTLYERALWAVVATIGLTLVFVYFAARNLDQIGDGQPRFTPGQSVLWLLLPVANIYMSHQVLTALWRDSQPRPGDARPRADFSVLAVNAWWALFWGQLLIHSTALQLAAAIAYIVVVLGIAARQHEQWIDLQRRRDVPQPTASALR